jgi:hypothetical protein
MRQLGTVSAQGDIEEFGPLFFGVVRTNVANHYTIGLRFNLMKANVVWQFTFSYDH